MRAAGDAVLDGAAKGSPKWSYEVRPTTSKSGQCMPVYPVSLGQWYSSRSRVASLIQWA